MAFKSHEQRSSEKALSMLPVFQIRCRGSCDYVQKLERHSLVGEQVGVRVLEERKKVKFGR